MRMTEETWKLRRNFIYRGGSWLRISNKAMYQM